MNHTPSVTGFNIIERTRSFIGNLLRQTDSPVLLLPSPRQQNATAATWERNAPVCEKHHAPNFRSLVTTDTLEFGEWYCSHCEQEKNEATILQLHTGKIHALFPASGQLARRIHMSEVRHSMQEDAVRDILAEIHTNKDLSQTPEAAMLLKSPQHTTPLPARDIERAITPPRTTLFADVPPVTVWEENDDDATERRRIVRQTPSTVQIPAMSAEVILEALMRGDTHAQSTGENERIPVQADDWLR